MFEEVCESALVLFFKSRPDFLSYIEVSLSFGILIVTDVVGEPIGEMTDAHIRVYWEWLGHWVLSLSICHRG